MIPILRRSSPLLLLPFLGLACGKPDSAAAPKLDPAVGQEVDSVDVDASAAQAAAGVDESNADDTLKQLESEIDSGK